MPTFNRNDTEDAKQLLFDFYLRVCERAERNIQKTGTVAGAHWNAMRQILAEIGIDTDANIQPE